MSCSKEVVGSTPYDSLSTALDDITERFNHGYKALRATLRLLATYHSLEENQPITVPTIEAWVIESTTILDKAESQLQELVNFKELCTPEVLFGLARGMRTPQFEGVSDDETLRMDIRERIDTVERIHSERKTSIEEKRTKMLRDAEKLKRRVEKRAEKKAKAKASATK
jgi:hypothetical protein